MNSSYKPSAFRRPFQRIHFTYREVFKIWVKTMIIFAWLGVFLFALLEIKRYYNIDVIPGYDSPVDDVYGMARGTLSNYFK